MSAAPDDIRSQLTAALAAQREQPEQEVETEAVEAAPETVETQTQAQERARDEKGRFAARDGASTSADTLAAEDAVAKAETASVAAAPVNAAAATKGDEQPKPEAALAPPNGWPAEAKAKWHELPAEIMAAVQKREQDIAKFTSTRDEHASFGKDMYQAIQPYLPTIRSAGGTPRGVVESMLQSAHVLYNGTPDQKRTMLLKTAREFGVDLGTAQSGQPAQNTPPEIQRLEQELAELRGVIAQQQNAGLQQLQTEVQTELEAFAADPKHQHFEMVKGHMAALIDKGYAKDLQDAYDQAVWARPDTRTTLLAQQRAEEEQKRVAEAKAKAEEKRKKSISVTGGPGSSAAAPAPGGRSIREELEAARAASTGAV